MEDTFQIARTDGASCIVLAGGKSVRLGRDKVREIIGNVSLLERTVATLAKLHTDILIVTAEKQPVPVSIRYPGVRMVNDVYPGKGSLGGLYSGLVASQTFYNFVVACDMPFLNERLVAYLLSVCEGYDVVIPRVDNHIEPLHAVYSKNCVRPIENLFNRGELQIFQFFPEVRVRHIETESIDKYDPDHLSFFNINTPTDLARAREIVSKKEDNH